MTGEINISLPGLKLANTRLNGQLNYRSARHLQASLGVHHLQRSHTASISYQLSTNKKFTSNLDIESPFIGGKKSLSFKTNFADQSMFNFEAKMDDLCQLVGSIRFVLPIEAEIKINCPNWKRTINLELAAGTQEGKLVINSNMQQHQLSYKIGESDISIQVQSDEWIEPIQFNGNWHKKGQVSIDARYGQQQHSVIAEYSNEDKLTGSIAAKSPFLPAGEASLQFIYQSMAANIQLDFMGQRHKMEGRLQNWPGFGAKFNLNSPALPWPSVALDARAEFDQINITCSYGQDQNLILAGRGHYSAWNNMGGYLQLDTPFEALPTARLDVHLVAPNVNQLNATIRLPKVSFNAHYNLNQNELDASAQLVTPLWQEVALKLTIPLSITDQLQTARLTAAIGNSSQYSIFTSLHIPSPNRNQLNAKFELDYGRKWSAHILLKAEDIYQARIELFTPIRGFERYSWDLKGQANVKRWGESTAFLDWNGER